MLGAANVTGLTNEERLAIGTLYRAFSEGRPELLDQAVAPDWQDIPLAPGQQPGREGMKPLIRGFVAAFPDLRITVHEIIGVPGRAGPRCVRRSPAPTRASGSGSRRPEEPSASRSMSSTPSRMADSPIPGTLRTGSAGCPRSAHGRCGRKPCYEGSPNPRIRRAAGPRRGADPGHRPR